jgi:hypothetical protein
MFNPTMLRPTATARPMNETIRKYVLFDDSA